MNDLNAADSMPAQLWGSPYKPGPKSLKLFQEDHERLAPGLQQIATLSQLALDKGRGAMLIDVDGREYLDFVAGVCVASIGHAHPEYVQALSYQAARLSVGSFTTENRVELGRRLVQRTPPGLNRFQLYSSGAEAVEAALRLAKSYTQGYEVVGFWGGFHGKTGGVFGLLDHDLKKHLGPWIPGTYLAPYPDPYRCPLGQETKHDCAAHCLQFLRELIRRNTSGALAAIIVEPIQGTAGNIVPAKGFLAGVGQIAHEEGALWICDEMITGFGRTGTWFGCEHEEVTPDVLIVGKGMAGGFPVSGIITTETSSLAKPFANPSGSSSSYGGNPLAAAAANATLRILESENLVENSRKLGELGLRRLQAFKSKFNFIGDVRGRGLLMGVELVQDRRTKKLLPKTICRAIFEEALQRGLLTMAYSPKIRINPPLNISQKQLELGFDILEESLQRVARRFNL
jgi:4-aminobutyrate aminotransferase-like enzyme